jgi:hypothetical protein
MRLPFLRKVTESEHTSLAIPDQSLTTPTYEYVPSDTLQLIIHLPANGFIHLQPPLDLEVSESPGQYDHILTGELEVFAPAGWEDTVQRVTVGVRSTCKLTPAKGREDEIDVLFERQVTLPDVQISPGSQK